MQIPDFWPWAISTASIMLAVKFGIDHDRSVRALKEERKTVLRLTAENSALKSDIAENEKRIADSMKNKNSCQEDDEFTKKLPYPLDSNR